MCEGFNLRFKRELQIQTETLKVIRWAGWMTYAVNRDRKKKFLQPHDLLPLMEFEEKKQVELPTKEEMLKIKSWIK